VTCDDLALMCTIDGEMSQSSYTYKRVLLIRDGSEYSGMTALTGLIVKRGKSDYGGGVKIDNAIVVMMICVITNNYAYDGGYDGGAGIYCDSISGAGARTSLNLYGVTFDNNDANNGGYGGDDLYNYNAAVTFHNTCPDGFESEARKGAPLDAVNDGGFINDSTFVYDGAFSYECIISACGAGFEDIDGDCTPCAAGSYGPGGVCVNCDVGFITTSTTSAPRGLPSLSRRSFLHPARVLV